MESGISSFIYLMTPIDFTNYQNAVCGVIWDCIDTFKLKYASS